MSTASLPTWSVPGRAALIWSPLKMGVGSMPTGSGWPSTMEFAYWFGTATKSRRPVVPTRSLISLASAAPGSSTVMRSPPWVWTFASATPVAFTRFSMMVRVWFRISGVTACLSVEMMRYSPRWPPTRSSPRLGQNPGQPSAVALGLGIRLAAIAATRTTTIRRGRAQRIGRDSSRSVLRTRPVDARRRLPAQPAGEDPGSGLAPVQAEAAGHTERTSALTGSTPPSMMPMRTMTARSSNAPLICA